MKNVIHIDFEELSAKYNIQLIDLVKDGLFTESDFVYLQKVFGYLSGTDRIKNILANIPYILNHIDDFIDDLDQKIKNQVKDVSKQNTDKNKSLKDRYPISDYIKKASICAAFKPVNILEIGTYYGWGSASLKTANPTSTLYTMNPEINFDANNPIEKDLIGSVCKNKNIKINQLWADSTKFDYATLPSIDVTYIDGNHEYDFVLSDLKNTVHLSKKAVILDDYIPNKDSPRGDVRAWGPWNAGVVKAVDEYVANYPETFKEAYWIKNSPICLIVK